MLRAYEGPSRPHIRAAGRTRRGVVAAAAVVLALAAAASVTLLLREGGGSKRSKAGPAPGPECRSGLRFRGARYVGRSLAGAVAVPVISALGAGSCTDPPSRVRVARIEGVDPRVAVAALGRKDVVYVSPGFCGEAEGNTELLHCLRKARPRP